MPASRSASSNSSARAGPAEISFSLSAVGWVSEFVSPLTWQVDGSGCHDSEEPVASRAGGLPPFSPFRPLAQSLGRSPHRYAHVVRGSAPLVWSSARTSGVWPIGVPEGRGESSTALQCRGSLIGARTSPVGTTDISSQLQSSLRDLRRGFPDCPGTEVPGYYHCVPTGTPAAPILESNNMMLLVFA